jgi:hypothetical protein
VWRERESRDYRTSGLDKKTRGREGRGKKRRKEKRIKNRKKGNEKKRGRKKLMKKTQSADGTRGIEKLSALVQNQGQPSHFVLYLTDARINTHSSDTEGCEILKQ